MLLYAPSLQRNVTAFSSKRRTYSSQQLELTHSEPLDRVLPRVLGFRKQKGKVQVVCPVCQCDPLIRKATAKAMDDELLS